MKKQNGFTAKFIITFGMMFLLFQCFGAEEFLEPLQGWRILIDPGTGGDLIQGPFIEETKQDLGTLEADVNMKIALFLSDSLKNAGAEVGLSREPSDLGLPTVEDRIKKADEFNPNLIISINHDYNKDSKENYVKAYYYPPDKEPDKSVAIQMVEALQNELDLPSRGAETYAYPFLARSKAPGIMISCGCISNKKYQKSLKDISFNLTQARGILKGMMNFQENLSIIKSPKPPLTIEKKSPLIAPQASAFSMPVPSVPASPAPVPQPVQDVSTPVPTPVQDVSTPVPTPVQQAIVPAETAIQQISAPVVKAKPIKDEIIPFKPPFLNPLGAPFDQSWLFGETWGSLPIRKGISFAAPEGRGVKAAEDGIVTEIITTPGPTGIQYPNSIIIEHKNVSPEIPVAYTIYAKLAEMKVGKGDQVKKGDVIGITGIPSTSNESSRDTEIEFQIRIGDLSENSIVNPELFTQHTSDNTGIIAGQIINKNDQMLSGIRIDGAIKTPEIERYSYSLTYALGVSPSKQYGENFAIGDVPEGEYYLSCEYGTKKVAVEKGKISIILWKVE